MKTYTLFKSRMTNVQYVTPDGKTVVFAQGRLATEDKSVISHLTDECEKGHPYIYIDPEQKTISEDQLDPHYALREMIRAEEVAKLKAATDPKASSEYDPKKSGAGTGIQNSVSINPAAVESGTSAALQALSNVSNTSKSAK